MSMKSVALSVWLVPLCALAVSAAACGESDVAGASDASTNSDASTDLDASTDADAAATDTCYATTPSDGIASKSWSTAGNDDIGEVTITAPADPGGGYFEVELKAEHSAVRPWIEVTAGAEGGAIVNGSSASFDVPVRRVAFAAAPSQSYKIRAWQFFAAPREAYPVSYSIEWKFTSLVDCYEPNDTAAAAQPVAFDQTIEAYATAGHVDNSTDYDRYLDWYSFELTEAATVSAEMTQAPGTDLRMRIRIFDEAGTRQLGSGGGSAPGELFTATTSSALAPGKYTFAVETATSSRVADDNVPTLRSEWTKPYQVRLTKTP